MTKLFSYDDDESRARQLDKFASPNDRSDSGSSWLLFVTAVSIALGVFLIGLGTLALYLRYRYG